MAEITITERVTKTVKYLQADCGVRYFEDGIVNGEPDSDENPRMPFASGEGWRPLIDLDSGSIVGWPGGVTAETHYKVCDAGRYTLLDADRNAVMVRDSYVPTIMCPEGNGYGDYVIMKIGPDGKIANWVSDLSNFERDID